MNETKFDYIIIGGGTAGATIAKMLSDNKKNSVLLLEAGEDNDTDEPITNSTFAPVLQNLFFPQYFWQGEGVPQEQLNNRTFRWTTGRLLGGAYSVNRQLWVRPTEAVITKWEELLGPTWSPQAVINRFKKIEDYNGETDNPEARGFNGRVDVRQAPVLKINFCRKTARGVSYLKDGEVHEACARKKVILSAGIKSPSIIMHSGIGPAKELENVGIDVIKDNANVGMHMANHSIIAVTFSTNPDDLPQQKNDANAHLIAGAFLPNPNPEVDQTLRAIQIEPFLSGNNLIVGVSPIQPKSRGTVQIQSDDPLKIELGDEEFLDNPADLQLLMDTFKIYIKNIATKLNEIDPNYKLLSPTMDVINDDTLLEAFIRQNLSLTFHEESTLRMSDSEVDGVTNFKGEVFGVKDLIVADNSIIPFTADGNTSAPAYLIGFTIAEQLLKEDKCCNNCNQS